MLDWIRNLLSADALSPHGVCLLWRPELIWTHVVSDILIGLAYFSIPLALGRFLYKRRDVEFGWMIWMFVGFIMLCGVTHFMSIWTLWNADYGVEAIVKAATGAASVATALALWPLLPRAIALPSPTQLRRVNEQLEVRIAERDAALAALERETQDRQRAEAVLHQVQKMDAVGQLTGGVAHDFNNLLTVVLGNLDRIARKSEDEEVRRAVSNAVAGAERAAALTQQLLSFARQHPVEASPQSANLLVETALSLTRASLGENIKVEVNLAQDAPAVLVDRNQAENALVNLIVNAREAMGGGGVLTLTTARERVEQGAAAVLSAGDYVRIEVSDTGAGMTDAVRERAFEPFFTTRPLGQGTGLGLSQVYGFVRQSGGQVEIDSAPGRGAKVIIRLPAAASAA
jgi:signal transduction histidine kinase